ncbi:putative E3 ubiquitin ligase [Trachipleistophora hominis]|uniref:Putative E3 ubiquitin ligase n=1 Tax=Trachipleistophora hominis TaxID=72359 RepID=L7JYF0_TRAHO|nr:putative E3 ubiquitin ligase [Trachipleistophora hominis]
MSAQKNDKRKVLDRINLRRRRPNTTPPTSTVETFYITLDNISADFDVSNILFNLFPLIERFRDTSTLTNIILYFYPVKKRNVLSRKSLNALKKRVYTDGDEQCTICLQNYAKNDMIRELTCKHEFHCKCVDRWLLRSSDCCPVCRKRVGEGD